MRGRQQFIVKSCAKWGRKQGKGRGKKEEQGINDEGWVVRGARCEVRLILTWGLSEGNMHFETEKGSGGMVKIDSIDRDIVNLLMEDGRMQAAEIARRIGHVSERVVRYRIDNLIQKQVITISAIVNPKQVGFEVVADVWLEVESDSVLEVARKMAAFENVSYVACSIGETDISLQLLAGDADEVYRFVTGVIGKVPGVRRTTISIVPVVIKDVFQWRIPDVTIVDLPDLVGNSHKLLISYL